MERGSEATNGNELPRTMNAVFESENFMSITSPCGHTVPIEKAIDGAGYCCPICGLRYHVEQDPAKVYPNGFVMPGDRRLVIEAQSSLPKLNV